MPTSRHTWALASYLGLAGVSVFAASGDETAKVVLLLSGKSAIYQNIADGERASMKAQAKDVVLSDSAKATLSEIRALHPGVVVAVGDPAALWTSKNSMGVPVIVSGVIAQSNPLGFEGMTGVSLDFPLSAYLETIKEFLPDVKRVGVFVNPSRNPSWGDDADKLGGKLGLEVRAEEVAAEGEVGPALQKMQDHKTQLVLMTCDPVILNPESFKYIIQFTISHGMGVVVPSSALLKPGGLLSLGADYADVGSQTGLLVNQLETGNRPEGMAAPRRKKVGINLKVAAALGFQFAPDAVKTASDVEK